MRLATPLRADRTSEALHPHRNRSTTTHPECGHDETVVPSSPVPRNRRRHTEAKGTASEPVRPRRQFEVELAFEPHSS